MTNNRGFLRSISLITTILGLSILVAGWRISGTPDKNNIRCFRITLHTPWFDSKWKTDTTVTFSSWFYTCENWRIYENTGFKLVKGSDGLQSRYYHWYFVFQKDSVYGYQYYLDSATGPTRLKVDSIKQMGPDGRRKPSHDDMALWFRDGRLKRAYTKKGDDANSWMEAYTEAIDTSGRPDSLYLFFSKSFREIPMDLHLTLSRGIDRLRHAKLVKMTLSQAAHYVAEDKRTIGPMESNMELAELTQFDRAKVFSWFVHYWRDIGAMHP